MRLFCFPYAGAGAQIYQAWPEGLPGKVEVYSVQLPGRGSRWNEAPIDRLVTLVQATAMALLPFLEKPFAFFGHSMGALIAFELARWLRKSCGLSPVHFFASGCAAPSAASSCTKNHLLPDAEFVEHIRCLDGSPPSLFDNSELMDMILPTLRADFAVCETYVYLPLPPLDCPITAFGGMQDSHVSQKEIEAWQTHTLNSFNAQMLPGGHFYLHEFQSRLLSIITEKLMSVKQPFGSRNEPQEGGLETDSLSRADTSMVSQRANLSRKDIDDVV